jgi:hypothetical protein
MKSYRCYWHDENKKQVLVFEALSRWTWEDAVEIVELQGTQMQTVPHKVHTIFQFERNVNWMPQGSAFSNLKRLMGMVHPNEDLIIFVGKNLLLEIFIRAVGNVYKFANHMNRYHFVHTMEEALALIDARNAA